MRLKKVIMTDVKLIARIKTHKRFKRTIFIRTKTQSANFGG